MDVNVLPLGVLSNNEVNKRVADGDGFVRGAGEHGREARKHGSCADEDDIVRDLRGVVGVVHVECVSNTDDQLRRGVADDFLGFFKSLITDDVLQADAVLDFERAFERDVQRFGDRLGDVVCA